jgi:hypothetical protein
VPGTSLTTGGGSIVQRMLNHRFGLAVDVDVELPWNLKLIAGGELMYDTLEERNVEVSADASLLEQRARLQTRSGAARAL